MNNILSRYLFKRTLHQVFVITVIVVSLLLFIDFIRQQGKVGMHEYQAWNALVFSWTLLPSRLTDVHVFVFFVGGTLTLFRLYETKEVVIMGVLGMKPTQIFWPFMAFSVIWFFSFLFIGDIGTSMEYQAKKKRTQLMSQGKILSTTDAMWLKLDNHILRFYMNERGEMENIKRFNFENKRLVGLERIDQGIKEGDYWFFKGVHAIDLTDVKKGPVESEDFYMGINYNLNHYDLLNLKPLNMNLQQLWVLSDLSHLGQGSYQYFDNFVNRICQPFFFIGLFALTFSFLFRMMQHYSQGVLLMGVLIISGFSQMLFALCISLINALKVGYIQANIMTVIFIFLLAVSSQFLLQRT